MICRAEAHSGFGHGGRNRAAVPPRRSGCARLDGDGVTRLVDQDRPLAGHRVRAVRHGDLAADVPSPCRLPRRAVWTPGGSAVVITAWQDETAVRELDGSPRYRDVVDSINETGFLAGEAALQVFT